MKRALRIFLLLAVAAFILLNIFAYQAAHSMLFFTDGGVKTPSPEALDWQDKAKALFTGINVPRPVSTRTPADTGLPYTSHRITTSDGAELATWLVPAEQPSGVSVALFHGYTVEKSALLPEAALLHSMGADLLLVDLRGSGDSSADITTIGYLEALDVQAADAFMRTQYPDQPLVLFGHSMGAAAMMRAINEGLIEPDAMMIEAIFDTLLNTVKHRFDTMGIPTFPAAHCFLFWGSVQCGFNGFTHQPVEYAKAVDCPALIMQGAHDPRVSAAEAKAVFNNLSGSATWALFPSVGHAAYAETSPDLWRKTVSEFLQSL